MSGFLMTTKGKIIAGIVTVAAIIAIILAMLFMGSGYRTVAIQGKNGSTQITRKNKVSEATLGMHLKSGDDAKVQRDANLTLALDDDKYVYAEPMTHFWLEAKGKAADSKTTIHLDEGSCLIRIDRKLADTEEFKVETPNATMSVRGTLFRVTLRKDEQNRRYSLLEVFDGKVWCAAKMEDGSYTGEEAEFLAGECVLVWSDPTFSEFMKDHDGEYVREIEYRGIPQDTAKVLGQAIDDGRELCIGKDLLYDLVDIIEHEFSSWEVVKEPTAQENGLKRSICDICGEELWEEIEKLPSETEEEEEEPVEAEQTKQPAAKKNTAPAAPAASAEQPSTPPEEPVSPPSEEPVSPPSEEPSTDPAEKPQEEPTDDPCAAGHDYVEGERVEPNCTKAGSVTKTCSRCGDVQTTELAATGHSYEYEVMDEGHMGMCTRDNCPDPITGVENHTFSYKDLSVDFHLVTCTVCGYEWESNHNPNPDTGICEDCGHTM